MRCIAVLYSKPFENSIAPHTTEYRYSKEIKRKIIVSVKGGGNVGAAMIRDLIGTMQNNKADIGLFVTLTH